MGWHDPLPSTQSYTQRYSTTHLLNHHPLPYDTAHEQHSLVWSIVVLSFRRSNVLKSWPLWYVNESSGSRPNFGSPIIKLYWYSSLSMRNRPYSISSFVPFQSSNKMRNSTSSSPVIWWIRSLPYQNSLFKLPKPFLYSDQERLKFSTWPLAWNGAPRRWRTVQPDS